MGSSDRCKVMNGYDHDSEKEYLFDALKSTCKVLQFKIFKCVVDETDTKSWFFVFSLQLLLISFP